MDEQVPRATLGKAIAIRRVELGLTRNDLRDRSGLSYPYVAELEKGQKSPSSRALSAIAAALDLRPHELLERAEILASSPTTDPLPPSGVRTSAASPSRWFGPSEDADICPSIHASQAFDPDDRPLMSSAPLDEDRVRQIVREELRRLLADGLD